MIKVEKPSLEEALEYIKNFGGIEKAMLRNNLSKWLECKDWWYHNACISVYNDWFLDELISVQESVESPTVDEFVNTFSREQL